MWELTRRRFLTRTSVGVGAAMAGAALMLPNATNAGMLPGTLAGPTMTDTSPTLGDSSMSFAELSAGGPMLLHVRDFATAEIAVMFGGQEFVYRDPELIARIVQAAAAGGAEG
jgi:hypothetical protein